MSAQCGGDDLPRVSPAVPLEVGGFDPVLQHPTQLERKRRAPAPDDEATQPARIQGRGEERSSRANVGTDGVRVLEPERVGDANDELAHRPRREQRIATLGMTEPRQVDRHQMRVFGESRPHRLEREQALRPRAQQEGVIVPVLALGEADGQPVDRPELHLDGCVRPFAHVCGPLSACGRTRSANASRRVSSARRRARIRQCTVRVASRRPAARRPGPPRLERRDGGRVAGQDAVELAARADAELDEDLAQVVLDRARTDEQAACRSPGSRARRGRAARSEPPGR